MISRRSFLRIGSLFVGAAAVAPELLVESEPVRRYWQVGRNAPVGSLRMRDPEGFRRTFGTFPLPNDEPRPTIAYDDAWDLLPTSGTRLALMDQAARDRDAYWAELSAQHTRDLAERMREKLAEYEARYNATLRDLADNIAAFGDVRIVIG